MSTISPLFLIDEEFAAPPPKIHSRSRAAEGLGRNLFPPYFGASQPEVLAIASQLMVIGAAYQIFDGGQAVASGLLRGCLDVRVPTLMTLVAYLGIQLPLAWWLGIKLGFGVQGMWWSFVVSLAFIAVLLIWRFFKVVRE